ncbi:hypothetical protein [Caenimonas sp. SL110]|uniref:hypothetical protein n=1 Tax=Caenimonas sp. SL110 TaxID=1450524 RepID=UPI0006544935|nr:hypothetical protein [Caenimonas sp. SL110]
MDINLIAFDAFALESLASPRANGASQTLTLQLSLEALPGFSEPLTGTASIAAADTPGQLRAAVVPADASELTITFAIEPPL